MAAEPRQRARFAEIVYASTEGGAGGWQVTSRTGEPSSDEEEALRAYVVTSFDSHEGPPPRFIDPGEVGGMPIRFGASPYGAGQIIWHANQAGSDATGRPGNVFSQVVLDRAPAGPPVAVALWRSPSFALPFGSVAVRAAAQQPIFVPRPGPGIDPPRRIMDPETLGQLVVLLDAIAASRNGAGLVVLRSGSQDLAADLVGSVCALTVPSWSRSLKFSLYERARFLEAPDLDDWDVVVVPVDDDLPKDLGTVGCVIRVDETELVWGEVGQGPHMTEAGSVVTATAWSSLAQHLSALPAEMVRSVIDSLATWDDPPDGEPYWWLALAMALVPGLDRDARDASLEVLRTTPAPLDGHDVRTAVLEEAVDRAASLQDIASELSGMDPRDGRYGVLAQRFIEGAVRDLKSLPSELPTIGASDGEHRTFGEPTAIRRALDDFMAQNELEPAIVDGLVSVLLVSGWIDRDDAAAAPVTDALRIVVLELSRSGTAGDVAQLMKRLPDLPLSTLLLDLADARGPDWQRQFLSAADTRLTDAVAGLDTRTLHQRVLLLQPFGLFAADRVLRERDDVQLVHRLAPAATDQTAEHPGRELAQPWLRPGGWRRPNRLAAARMFPRSFTSQELMGLIVETTPDEFAALERSVGDIDRPELQRVRALRLQADQVVAQKCWPPGWTDLVDRQIVVNARRLEQSASARWAVRTPSIWFLVAIADLLVELRSRRDAQDLRTMAGSMRLLRNDRRLQRDAPVDIAQIVGELLGERAAMAELERAIVVAAVRFQTSSRAEPDAFDRAIAIALRHYGEADRSALIDQAERLFARDAPSGRLGVRRFRRSPLADYVHDLLDDLEESD